MNCECLTELPLWPTIEIIYHNIKQNFSIDNNQKLHGSCLICYIETKLIKCNTCSLCICKNCINNWHIVNNDNKCMQCKQIFNKQKIN